VCAFARYSAPWSQRARRAKKPARQERYRLSEYSIAARFVTLPGLLSCHLCTSGFTPAGLLTHPTRFLSQTTLESTLSIAGKRVPGKGKKLSELPGGTVSVCFGIAVLKCVSEASNAWQLFPGSSAHDSHVALSEIKLPARTQTSDGGGK